MQFSHVAYLSGIRHHLSNENCQTEIRHYFDQRLTIPIIEEKLRKND